MADQLQIIIGADTAPLQQGLNAATKAVDAFDKNVKKTVTSSGQATLALSNLGRVASDAPFGFIAIANNIEPLIQSFQSLGKTSGGVGGALKALGGSLLGAGGLLFGFSLLSSAVTVAVQKYGSLGNAINAIFGQFTQLDQQVLKAGRSYQKFNENLRTSAEIAQQEGASVQGQISRVQALAAIANDQTRTYNERNSALKELTSINKTYFGDLKIEDGLVKGLTTTVQDYTKSIIDSAKAKGFEAEIGKLAPQLAEQTTLLEALRKKRDEVANQPFRIVGAAATRSNAAAIQEASNAYELQRIRVGELQKRLSELESQLTVYTAAQVQDRIATDAATEAQRKKTEAERLAKEARDRNIQSTRDAIDAERLLNLELEIQRRLRAAPTAVALDPAISRISEIAAANSAATKSATAELNKLKQAFGFDIFMPQIDFSGLEQKTIGALRNVEAASNAIFEGQRKQVASITDAFNNLLAPSIDAVFSALATGQNAFKALGDSLKQLVIQLVATVIKAAALAAVISAITGTPFNVALKGTLSGSQQLGNLSTLTGGGRIGGAAAPSFPRGTAFSGGGMQLAGNVTFVQRGPDLVGVLNQGNARINRVG